MTASLVLGYVLCITTVSPATETDINSVYVRGSSAEYGMWIKFVKEYDFGFRITTTGADFIFEKENATLKLHQLIGAERLLAQITFGSGPQEIQMRVNTPDHVLFEAKDFFLGIYGDSVCILAPKRDNLRIGCLGNFLPEYAGRLKGEFFIADIKGGVTLYPQRYEAGYEVIQSNTNQKNWQINYVFSKNQRMMIGVFPPRQFNWEQSFRDRVVVCNGFTKDGVSTGQLVDDATIRAWKEYVNVILLFNGGFYAGKRAGSDNIFKFPGREPYRWPAVGPYTPKRPEELRRVVSTAHSMGMKVIIYVSALFHYKMPDDNAFFEEIADTFRQYNIDGFYIDCLYQDWKQGLNLLAKHDRIKNYELIRRMRQLVGPEGILFFHGSGDRNAVTTAPNIDAICDYVLYGEGVPFRDFNDPYIQFQVRKYGISNTIGMIKADKKPKSITTEQIYGQMLEINNRERWWAHYRVDSKGNPVWPKTPPDDILQYYQKLNDRQEQYYTKSATHKQNMAQ